MFGALLNGAGERKGEWRCGKNEMSSLRLVTLNCDRARRSGKEKRLNGEKMFFFAEKQ
jgi:hypothetical protein